MKVKMKLSNPDSALVGLKETHSLADAHFKDRRGLGKTELFPGWQGKHPWTRREKAGPHTDR